MDLACDIAIDLLQLGEQHCANQIIDAVVGGQKIVGIGPPSIGAVGSWQRRIAKEDRPLPQHRIVGQDRAAHPRREMFAAKAVAVDSAHRADYLALIFGKVRLTAIFN